MTCFVPSFLTEPVAHSVPAETEPTITSEEILPPIESETSGTKQAAEDTSTDTSTAEPTPSLESGTAEVAPVETTAVQPVPDEPIGVEPAPSQSVPVEAPPVDSVPPSEEVPASKASDEPLGTKSTLPFYIEEQKEQQ